MPRNKKKICIMATILAILTTALVSCKSAQQKSAQEQKTIQIEAQFPNPFDENGKAIVTLENNGIVTMPLWYWLKITDYVIDVEANKELQKK